MDGYEDARREARRLQAQYLRKIRTDIGISITSLKATDRSTDLIKLAQPREDIGDLPTYVNAWQNVADTYRDISSVFHGFSATLAKTYTENTPKLIDDTRPKIEAEATRRKFSTEQASKIGQFFKDDTIVDNSAKAGAGAAATQHLRNNSQVLYDDKFLKATEEAAQKSQQYANIARKANNELNEDLDDLNDDMLDNMDPSNQSSPSSPSSAPSTASNTPIPNPFKPADPGSFQNQSYNPPPAGAVKFPDLGPLLASPKADNFPFPSGNQEPASAKEKAPYFGPGNTPSAISGGGTSVGQQLASLQGQGDKLGLANSGVKPTSVGSGGADEIFNLGQGYDGAEPRKSTGSPFDAPTGLQGDGGSGDASSKISDTSLAASPGKTIQPPLRLRLDGKPVEGPENNLVARLHGRLFDCPERSNLCSHLNIKNRPASDRLTVSR